jgi:hypothetical protein
MAFKRILILIIMTVLVSYLQPVILHQNSTIGLFQNASFFQTQFFNNFTNNATENPTQPLVIKLGTGKIVFVCIFTAVVIAVIIFLHYKTTTKLKNIEMKRPIYRGVSFVPAGKKSTKNNQV